MSDKQTFKEEQNQHPFYEILKRDTWMTGGPNGLMA